MKREDIRTLSLFIIAILIIILLFLYNDFVNRHQKVDRKIDYIFGNFTYDNVLKEGSNLFFRVLKVMNTNNFTFELDRNGDIKLYNINDYVDYKKILDFNEVTSSLASAEVAKYMLDKKIIKEDNHYYVPNFTSNFNYDYIGSIITLTSYDDNYVYFKSSNYYCTGATYIGALESEPECSYKTTLTNFEVILEQGALRINNYDNLKKIVE